MAEIKEALETVGWLFIFLSILTCLGGLIKLWTTRVTMPEFEDYIKALGLASIIVWLIIGFGVASWLVGWFYVSWLGAAEWISEKFRVPLFLALCSPAIIIVLLGLVANKITSIRSKRQ